MEGAVGVREPVVVAAKADTARRADSTARIQQQSWTSRTTPQATAIGAPAIKAATAESTGRGCTRFVAARSPPPPSPLPDTRSGWCGRCITDCLNDATVLQSCRRGKLFVSRDWLRRLRHPSVRFDAVHARMRRCDRSSRSVCYHIYSAPERGCNLKRRPNYRTSTYRPYCVVLLRQLRMRKYCARVVIFKKCELNRSIFMVLDAKSQLVRDRCSTISAPVRSRIRANNTRAEMDQSTHNASDKSKRKSQHTRNRSRAWAAGRRRA
jgi:hypothetical protein